MDSQQTAITMPSTATGIESTVTFDGSGITFASAKETTSTPLASVSAVVFVPPTAKNGLFGLVLRTTGGDVAFDVDRPDGRRSVGFTAEQADAFRALAGAIDAAKPGTPVPMDVRLMADGSLPVHRRKWFWPVVATVAVLCLISSISGNNDAGTVESTTSTTSSQSVRKHKDTKAERELETRLAGYKGQDAAGVISDLESKGELGAITTGDGTNQTDAVKTAIAGGTAYTVTDATASDGKAILTVDTTDHYNRQREIANATPEQRNALTKAEQYSDNMHMSRQGLYDQLTSQYGERFSPDAANWALDHLDADYNANALAKAKEYQDSMAMSPESIREQLTSQYGEKFTQDEANYAIEHLND